MHHLNGGPVCPLCEEKLSQCDEFLASWFRTKVKPQFPTAHISWGFRGEQDQNEAVASGKSHEPWPTSPHNHSVDGQPRSKALDLFLLTEQNEASFDPKFYASLENMNLMETLPLKWGGSFTKLKDLDHFELTDLPT